MSFRKIYGDASMGDDGFVGRKVEMLEKTVGRDIDLVYEKAKHEERPIYDICVSECRWSNPRDSYFHDLDQCMEDIGDVPRYIKAEMKTDWKRYIDSGVTSPYLSDLSDELRGSIEEPMYLAQKNKHERDSRVVFVDKPHAYYIDGKCGEYVSASGINSMFFPKFNSKVQSLKTFNTKTFGMRKNQPSYAYCGCTCPEDIIKRWDRNRDLGTIMHRNFEEILNSDVLDIIDSRHYVFEDMDFTDAYLPMVKKGGLFEKFGIIEENYRCMYQFLKLRQSQSWRWRNHRTEWCLFDDETKLCGTIDYFGIIPETGNGIIADFKRTPNITAKHFDRKNPPKYGSYVCSDLMAANYFKYSIQQNMYRWLEEKNYGIPVKAMFLYQFNPKKFDAVIHPLPNMQSLIQKIAACRKKCLLEQERNDLLE
jgi:hypothetical protein